MSDSPLPPAEPAKTPAAPPSSPRAKQRREHTLRHRLWIIALSVLLIASVIRLSLGLLLQVVTDHVAGEYGLKCQYDRLTLSLLGGTAYVWGLQLRPKAGGDAIVRAEYLQGYISPLNLLRGRLVVWRAEADGVDIFADRDADGSIPLLKRFLPQSSAGGSASSPAAPAAPAKPWDLQAPLRVDAVRLSHVNIHFRDLSVSPAFQTQVQATVRLSDIGNAQAPARVDVEVGADPVLDSLHIYGVVHNTATTIDAEMHLLLRGLHPKPASAYLLAIGLHPIAEDVSIRGDMQLKVQSSAASPDLSGTLAISDISATADGQPFASLKTVSLDASLLKGRELKLGQLLVEDGQVTVERSPAGRVQCGGFELVSAGGRAEATEAETPSAKGKQPAAAGAVGKPFAFLNFPAINAQLREIRLADLRLMLVDQTFVPAIASSAKLDSLSIKNVVLDPSRAKSPVTIDGAFSIPGIVRSIAIKGQAAIVPADKKLSLSLHADGIRPDGAKPYLDRLGIDSEFADGSLTGQLDAGASLGSDGIVSGEASITDVKLTDIGRPLAAISKAAIHGEVKQMPWGPAISIGSADVQGPDLAVRRDADGGIFALGLRLRPLGRPAAPPAGEKNNTGPSPLVQLPGLLASLNAISLPDVYLGQATWNAHVRFVDEMGMLDQPVLCSLWGRIHDVTFVPHRPPNEWHAAAGASAGKFEAGAKVPGLADDMSIDGVVHQINGKNLVDASIKASGITGRAATPYLKQLGIVPALKGGRFESQFETSWVVRKDSIEVGCMLAPTALRDSNGTVLASVAGAIVSQASIAPTGIAIDAIQINRPILAVQRNRDGTFSACGMRVGPLNNSSPSPAPSAEPAAIRLPTLAIPLKVDSFIMQDGEIHWTDNATAPVVKASATALVSLSGIDFSNKAPPAHLHVSASVSGTLDRATVDGTLDLAPDAPSANLTVDATGIRAGPLSSYLPANMSSTLHKGHFSAGIEFSAKNNPAGGIAGRLAVRDLSFTDVDPPTDWAHVGQFTADARRIDPAGGVIAIDEISSSGVSAMVRRLPSGGIEAGGLKMESSPAADPPAAVPTKGAAAIAPAAQRAVNVSALVAAARRPVPLVTIDRLDLRADRLTVEGAIDPNGAPLSLADVRLHAPGRLVLGGPNSAAQGPVQLLADGELAPIAKNFEVNLTAWPFAAEPGMKMDVKASGISGQGIIDVIPPLGAIVQGKELTDGTLTTHVSASVNYGRRGPRDFDLSRGFVANFLVSPLQYRDTPDGPVVAGFQSLHGEGISVKPLLGDVRAKLIEMSTPIGRFYRDGQGLHALGLVIPLSSEKSESPGEAKNVRIKGSATPATPRRSGPPIRPSGEIRLDRFTISGIDMLFEDRTTTPVTEIPLKTLDVEINDVSNQMPWTGQQARFSVLCTSDKVWLPARQGEVGTAATRSASGEYLEQRDLLSEITATGKIGIRYRPDGSPMLDGWAKTAVDGFELLGVRGIAEQYKVKIGGGVFDDTNDVRFEPDGIKTQNQIVFTNLSLSEPANGPLQRGLKLPVPIDVAIGAMTDPDGSITVNLPVPIKNGAISWDDVYAPAVGAVAGVIATAVASAPLKAAGDVLGILGLGGKAGTNAPQIARVGFPAGYAGLLDPGERVAVAAIAEKMRKDPTLQIQIGHELSAADVARAAVRANPTPQQCLALADRLRRQKDQLLARRADLAAEARGEIPSQSPAAPATLAQLRDTDRELAAIESSLDQLYNLLRPGASAQASRRTRQASLELARARMETIRNALAGGDRALLDRIHMTVAQSTVAAGTPTSSDAGGSVVLTLVFKRH